MEENKKQDDSRLQLLEALTRDIETWSRDKRDLFSKLLDLEYNQMGLIAQALVYKALRDGIDANEFASYVGDFDKVCNDMFNNVGSIMTYEENRQKILNPGIEVVKSCPPPPPQTL